MSKMMPSKARFTRQLLALAMTSLFISASAVAQTRATEPTQTVVAGTDAPKPPGPGRATSTVSYKHKTTYDFDDEDVTGANTNPEGILVTSPQLPKQPSLLHIRADFQPEMLKSVETM